MPGLSFYERQHVQKVLAQQSVISNIFNQFILSVSPYLRKWNDTGKSSVWVRNQSIEKAVDRELLNLESLLKANISAFQKDAWERSNTKNDDFIRKYIEGMSISSAVKEGMFTHNLSALAALQNSVDAGGMSLSNRVWNIGQQTKKQLEFYLDSGVSVGRNANGISSDIRQLLHEPDKRFRRVRDEEGKLVPSQPMKDYHPGQGVYRSAYMNALRTSATTTNTAYRSADYERWSKQDFTLGIEIHRSANHKGPCKICDAMVGKYPKTFKFTGFHPFCICFATPIVMEPEDFADYLFTDEVPEQLVVTSIPQRAQEYVKENKDGLQSAYWYQDNFTVEGTPLRLTSPTPTQEPARVTNPKRIKTDEEKDDIQQRWNDRAAINFNQKRIEQKLYIKRGKDMTFEEANALKGNIDYGKGTEYRVNCQSCVVANELRRRGYDVTAMPNLKLKGNLPYELSLRTEWVWIDPVTGKQPKKIVIGGRTISSSGLKIVVKPQKVVLKELADATKEPGRYHINWGWKKENCGHIVTFERFVDGKCRWYDPQTGKINFFDKEMYNKMDIVNGIAILRVDNLLVNTDIINGVVRKL